MAVPSGKRRMRVDGHRRASAAGCVRNALDLPRSSIPSGELHERRRDACRPRQSQSEDDGWPDTVIAVTPKHLGRFDRQARGLFRGLGMPASTTAHRQ
jgi:hypothetical protein